MTFGQQNGILMLIFGVFTAALGYTLGHTGNNNHQETMPVTAISATGAISNDNVFSTPKIKKAIQLIQKSSYGFVNKNTTEIEDNVLKSIVNGLGDKHSTYFTKKETKEFQEALRGDFEGIGAVINEHPKGIKIMKVIQGSPAEKSGLINGDILTHAGEKSLIGETTENAVTYIRGPKGSKVQLTYLRGDMSEEKKIEVTRDVVNVPTVAEKMLTGSIGYMEVATFGEHTTREFIRAWNSLTASGAQAMVLDFRNNGGGYLETAVELATTVLPPDTTVVTIKENNPNNNETLYTKTTAKSNINIPLVILINDFSASASEIFAGALKDHSRAVLLGEKSYGKGSVQEPFDLGDGSIIKITTARWYTPNDLSIDEKGIQPDIKVSLSQKDYEQIFDRQLEAAKIVIVDMQKNKMNVTNTIEKYKNNPFTDLKP